MPARVTAPAMAAEPSCGAVAGDSTPWKAPMGVRVAAAMMTCVLSMSVLRHLRSITAAKATVEHVDESIGNFAGLE
jgi:hypothetical protein